MASRRVEAMNEGEETITRGTGNVFADLGYPDADERQTKLRLAHAINGVLARGMAALGPYVDLAQAVRFELHRVDRIGADLRLLLRRAVAEVT